MIPLSEAQRFVLDGCHALEPEVVASKDALGLVAAETLAASELVPPFDNSAVDGFAVIASDTTAAPVTLKVVETISAGRAPTQTVRSGETARIMTGAPMPHGAEAVVMVEYSEPVQARPNELEVELIKLNQVVDSGHCVRRAGEDMSPGQTVLDAATRLSAGHLGVLATLGIESIRAFPRPTVGVISTGDELVEGSAKLEPGQIRDSNRQALLALVSTAGAEALDLGLVADDEAEVTTALLEGASRCDAIVTSGGVSMGDFDYVKTVLSRIAEMRWMQVAIKPGKPLAFGTLSGTPVFGLPGNPVSSMVSFELFARPGLNKMMGLPESVVLPQTLNATVQGSLPRRADGKVHFARVAAEVEEGTLTIRSAGGQGSHQLLAMATANALAVLADGSGASNGDTVPVILLHR